MGLTEGTAVRDGSERFRPDRERETTETARVSAALASGEAEIELRDVSKLYRSRDRETLALTGIDLGIRKREFVALVGQSGCGKTTMLRVLAGLIKPTSGEVTVAGRPLWSGDRRDDDALRKLGLVFQDAHLFPTSR